ncbi:DMT family transporter [Streptomyces longispororuber]|uniref:DMT family transporter n=1 Tax=Streptomyces longispororuber TaxID=68230 RepID=UPI00210A7694|nr:DMT family transporter [Streptomyces longispororuber]MCQ4206191.1 DMT family transporter [Streptomyces longispororuber]
MRRSAVGERRAGSTAPATREGPGPAGVAVLAAVLVALLAGTWLLSGALVEGTDPLVVAAGRTGVCCAVLAGCAAARAKGRHELRQVPRQPGTLALLALLGFAAYAMGTLLALPRIGTSLTNLVVALMPCASLAVGALLFGQRATVRQAAGAALATAATGAYAVRDGAGRVDLPGLGLAVAGMLAFAAYGFLYRRRLGGVAPSAALPVLLGLATLMMLPFAVPADGASLARWGGIVLLGGAVYAPAYLVQHRLILLRGPVFTAAVQLAVPFTVRLGDWALGPAGPPTVPELALLGCALAGIALVTVRRGGQRTAS